jgi:uncharacterized protein
MSLYDQITKDITTAMKNREADKLTALRAIKSELMLAKTKDGATELTDEIEMKCVQKLVKQRKDSAEIFKTQGRNDLYEKEILEVSFIEPYLPKQMSEAEIEAVIKEIITQTGASSPKDMGKVMGVASKQLAGKADGKLIAEKVKSLLGQ